jgi:trehalose/maltose hydrolase-like predicted phosphorylase
MFPSLLAQHPDLAGSVVDYRVKTLPQALQNTQDVNNSTTYDPPPDTPWQGSFFPWNGAGTGDLWSECHSWSPPHCITQIHLQGDIALAAWQQYLATGDKAQLAARWPLLDDIAQFWASRVSANGDGSYSIDDVAGPDEYSNGVRDGVYTNAVAATALRNAVKAAGVLGKPVPGAQWNTIAGHLRIPFGSVAGSPPIYLQYDGYAGSLIKQADTVLLIYPLEWQDANMNATSAANTLDFYAAHTDPDGPAMTDAIHAIDSAQIGEPGCATNTYLERSILPFVRDPFAQFAEARGDKAGAQDPLAGAPAFDFLTGAGGFLQVFDYGLTGLRWREHAVHLDPMLPPQLSGGVTLTGLRWQGHTFDVKIGATSTTVTARGGGGFTVEDRDGATHAVGGGGSLTLPTRRPDLATTTNVARCDPATATSEEPGMYADAAVDGSTATAWTPTTASASETVDLRQTIRIRRVVTRWTATPASSTVLTSSDGTTWTAVSRDSTGKLAPSVTARYVRVQVTRSGTTATGLRELEVYP